MGYPIHLPRMAGSSTDRFQSHVRACESSRARASTYCLHQPQGDVDGRVDWRVTRWPGPERVKSAIRSAIILHRNERILGATGMRAGNDFQDNDMAGRGCQCWRPASAWPRCWRQRRKRRPRTTIRRCRQRKTERRPSVNDADIMKDIDVSKLDWSQLNVDASTLPAPAPKATRRAKAAPTPRQPGLPVERPNGASGRVGQAIGLAVLGHADRRRHDGRPAGHADGVRTAVGKTRQRRQPAAIVRHRVGGDHRARRWPRSGTRPRWKPASIPDRSRASSAPP